MASNGAKSMASNMKNGPPSASSITSSNPSILLDKFNARRSTPDSEALASSEDEADANRQEYRQPSMQPQKPARRASWLNDLSQSGVQPRKSSFASGTMSPTHSNPTTPSVETGSWAPHSQAATTSAAPRGVTAFPWGTGIWNNESRKEPPSRLTEVLPSPTSTFPPGYAGNGFFAGENSYSRDQVPNTTIPFAIPLHPTPKTYRSQSYSVGQLDPDSTAAGPPPAAGIPTQPPGRGRPLQHSGLQHRPSRPSMLSEMTNDGGLGKVKEVDDDDDDSTNGSGSSIQLQSNDAKMVEMLARENAMLRQQQQQYQNSRLRPRASTTNAFAINNGYGHQDSLPEESDYAIDELDEINELQEMSNKGSLARRLSEYAAGQNSRGSPYVSLENRKIENVKKAYWQSSLGFGGLGDIPQSRRHSFADVPTRQGSVGSVGEQPLSAHESNGQENLSPKGYQGRFQDGAATGYSYNDHGEQTSDRFRRPSLVEQKRGQILEEASMRASYSHQRFEAASYFGGPAALPRNVDAYNTTAYPSYGLQAPYGAGRAPSPHRGMYGVPQPRHNQLLYIVLFKCSRADVFYVQEGTGLSVKPGDLVIVEADRGTDLGTVARDNIDWTTAKEMKEHYAEEHYKWLMMYSQGAAGNTDGTGAGLMAASNGLQGSAVGGMGPPTQHGMQEPNPGEIKPKIIKRLAQNHEIQALRDKEGNEAKAKRVCMQKVKEHGLHMEILDAEFQMDWKKLTFYYFADAYINFNSLVTDLFKVYKTRIWMSAINPASFASPSLGLQAPSGIGPGAVGISRSTQNERRAAPSQQHQQQAEPSASYGATPQAGRGFQSPFAQPYASALDRASAATTAFQPSGYSYPYPSFNAAPRNVASPNGFVGSGMLPSLDPYSTFSQPSEYSIPARFPSPHSGVGAHDGADYSRQGSGLGASNDAWLSGAFQGLSMNSR
ncbi:PSP1 domain-containing protein [Phlyctema vagabunda]|uniref:PSP1 domain-containing protein n=1 Tax=Phlyctema vagabunda TaxID=108571 RepID=A0ABR4P3A4_9HELO